MRKNRQLVVVDPFPVVVAGVRRILADTQDWEVRLGTASLNEAVAAMGTGIAPDVCLLDESFAPEAVAALLAAAPQTDEGRPMLVCVWGMETSPARAAQYLAAGAFCVFSKTCQTPQLISVLREALDGIRYVDPAFSAGAGGTRR